MRCDPRPWIPPGRQRGRWRRGTPYEAGDLVIIREDWAGITRYPYYLATVPSTGRHPLRGGADFGRPPAWSGPYPPRDSGVWD